MFYDRFKQLCEEKGVSCNKAALDIGLSNATQTKWRKTGATPRGDTLDKIAAYFDVSTDYLLGKEEQKKPTQKGERDGSEIMFALSRGGEQEITDEMFDEVKKFAAYIAQREKDKK
jgi:transcriptional regulator with XRE-family HTH domain